MANSAKLQVIIEYASGTDYSLPSRKPVTFEYEITTANLYMDADLSLTTGSAEEFITDWYNGGSGRIKFMVLKNTGTTDVVYSALDDNSNAVGIQLNPGEVACLGDARLAGTISLSKVTGQADTSCRVLAVGLDGN